MLSVVGIQVSSALLSHAEEETLGRYFAYLFMPPESFAALPVDDQVGFAAFAQSHQLTALALTRTTTTTT